MNGSWRKYLID